MVTFKSCWAGATVAVVLAGQLILGSTASGATETTNFANCRVALDGANISISTGSDLRITFTSCPAAVTSALFLASSAPVASSFTVDINGARFTREFDGGRWRIAGNGVAGASTPMPEGTYQIFFRIYDDFNNVQIFGGSFTVNVTPPAVVNPPTPSFAVISLETTDGSRCSQSSQSGVIGEWMKLPEQRDCTPPALKPNARLLGWATSTTFPIEIAKRQVDNGWGAYETFNADGQLTGVFIPAGGATFLSADGRLYPIWS